MAARTTAVSERYSGAQLFLPRGLYDASARIQLYGGLVSDGATIRFPELPHAALWPVNVEDVHFEGFHLVSTSTLDNGKVDGVTSEISTASSHAVLMQGVRRFSARNITATGRFVMGFAFFDCHEGETHNLTATNTDADGVHTTNGSSDIHHYNPKVTDSGDDGVACVSYDSDPARCERIWYHDIAVRNVRRARGATLEGGLDCGVDGGRIDGTAGRGVLVNYEGPRQTTRWPTINPTVRDLTVSNAGAQGVDFNGLVVGGRVERVTVIGAANQSVRLFRAHGVLVEDLLSEDNRSQSAVEVIKDPGNIGNQVVRSVIRRAATRGIYDQGIGTRIIGNEIDHPGAEAVVSFNPSGQVVVGNRALMPIGATTAFALTGEGSARQAGNTVLWDGEPGMKVYVSPGVTA